MSELNLKVKKLDNYVNGPARRVGDAAWDLFSTEDWILKVGERRLFNVGFSMQFSSNFVMKIEPRSGKALDGGIDVMAGVIDSTYGGPIMVLLINHGDKPFVIGRGDKIAQMVAYRIEADPNFEFVEELEETERGSGGFGSTGS